MSFLKTIQLFVANNPGLTNKEIAAALEKLYGDVPRIELFSRCGAPGWDHWGNQSESPAVELIPAVAVPMAKPQERAA